MITNILIFMIVVLGTWTIWSKLKQEKKSVYMKTGTTFVIFAFPLVVWLMTMFSGSTHNVIWIGILVGLLLSMVADYVIDKKFIAGLILFLLAHLCYISSFITYSLSFTGWQNTFPESSKTFLIIGIYLICSIIVFLITRFILMRNFKIEKEMKIPVNVYSAIISAMIVAAISTFNPIIITGAVLFFLSDYNLGYNMFKEEIEYGVVINFSTYYAAQAFFACFLLSLV